MGLGFQLFIMAVFGCVCAAVATSRGRSGVGWFFIGVLFGCLGLIILLVIPDLKVAEERHLRLARENRRLREMVRKDRTIADQRHGESLRRLGAHDRALGLDTAGDQQQLAGQPAAFPTLPPTSDETSALTRVLWHYIVDGGQQGPVEFGFLKTLWKAGRLPPDAYVWTEEMNDWLPIADVRGMQSELDA